MSESDIEVYGGDKASKDRHKLEEERDTLIKALWEAVVALQAACEGYRSVRGQDLSYWLTRAKSTLERYGEK